MNTRALTSTAGSSAQRAPLRSGVGIAAAGLRVEHRTGITALDDVTLTIEPGMLTAVIGPSGAGKSTLLAALAGLTPAQRGAVAFVAPDGTPATAGVGFVPQDDILHTELPLRRTLRYATALRLSAPQAVVDDAVDHAMRTLGLDRYGDVPVHSLSGGQRKRASIACEILTRPGVCLLDEPTSGLDPSAAADLVAHLRGMCIEGSTVVFTTHSVEDVARSDRVVVLAPGGRLVAVGTPAGVLDRLAPTPSPTSTAGSSTTDARRPRPSPRIPAGPAGPPLRVGLSAPIVRAPAASGGC